MIRDENHRTSGIVVCYKSIYINSYNILLVNLQTNMIVFRHEHYHLWEASISSILLDSGDLVICSKDGKYVLSIGNQL